MTLLIYKCDCGYASVSRNGEDVDGGLCPTCATPLGLPAEFISGDLGRELYEALLSRDCDSCRDGALARYEHRYDVATPPLRDTIPHGDHSERTWEAIASRKREKS